MQVLFVVATVALLCVGVHGHGKMMDPINRASRWMVDPSAPIDYDDNQLYCGGMTIQHVVNGGKCGFCGDDYRDMAPRLHENRGKYGKGVIVKTYQQGSTFTAKIDLDANHKGWFQFSICKLADKNTLETEECFKNITLADGRDIYHLPTKQPGIFNIDLKLPNDLTCDFCVLRWHYNAGNTWGICEDGEGRDGCGPQENFRSCSDIKIVSRKN